MRMRWLLAILSLACPWVAAETHTPLKALSGGKPVGNYPISLNAYVDGQLLPCHDVRGDRPVYTVDGKERVASKEQPFFFLSSGNFAPGFLRLSDTSGVISTTSSGPAGIFTPSRTTGSQIQLQTIEVTFTANPTRDFEAICFAVVTYDVEGNYRVGWKRVNHLRADREERIRIVGPGVYNDAGGALHYAIYAFEDGVEVLSSLSTPGRSRPFEALFMRTLIERLVAQTTSNNVPLRLFHRPPKLPPSLEPESIPESVEIRLEVTADGFPENLEIAATDLHPTVETWIRDYVSSWRFVPTIRRQTAIAGHVETSIVLKTQ